MKIDFLTQTEAEAYVREAINVVLEVMRNENTSPTVKLKAATTIIETMGIKDEVYNQDTPITVTVKQDF